MRLYGFCDERSVACPVCGEEDEWDGESCIRCVKCYFKNDECSCPASERKGECPIKS